MLFLLHLADAVRSQSDPNGLSIDKCEQTVEVKGGFQAFRGRNIIITSPKYLKNWYYNLEDDCGLTIIFPG